MPTCDNCHKKIQKYHVSQKIHEKILCVECKKKIKKALKPISYYLEEKDQRKKQKKTDLLRYLVEKYGK